MDNIDRGAPMLLLLLSILVIILTTSTSSAATTPSSPSHFLEFNVDEAIAGTKLKHVQEEAEPEQQQEQLEWKVKLKLLHRDKIHHSVTTISNDHRTRFNARIKRDVRRVAFLLRRLSSNNYAEELAEAAAFGSDDVVSGTAEGSGEYFVRIGVGSPPTYQYMVIDSGSDIVWVQCQPCDQCYNQTDPIFNPALSASFTGVRCPSAVCGQLDGAACHEKRCGYEVSYGDGSSTKGTLALETLTVGRTVIRKTAIGCGHWNEGMFVGAAGLLGLGGGPMSFVGQLGAQTDGAFGYCLLSRGAVPEGSSGSLRFGRQAMPIGAVWVPLIPNPFFPTFYYVALSGLGVGGLRLNISEDVFRITDLGDGGVVMDTGTAVTRLPAAAYNIFRDAFVDQTTNLPRASRVSIFDTCYNLSGFVSVRVPTVSFYFSGGQILTLPARNFLIPADDIGTFCFAFAPSPYGLSIIGNVQQEGIQISVDAGNGFVGFGPNVC
ncbi:protein ASPARTIC PROTEASE IN GUARD CELL 2 isoform X2 [Lotus japonicus]|uniref:protein ASPARTIC PROTEASE IN GUARD CELL 2 isoform X1 n=1 Tax=Lotus japonicus TaxID=34305 RepID=UPI00258FA86E|nr:protein ASPARTIC PROTEASE IN GUARD CELL 2 isoform X1 [Lotus japonicus]XP_057445291.1 protein ASPARTIC PROTEASE IN GUARD CELL 2 isoform X2 [Lotus japonicus]